MSEKKKKSLCPCGTELQFAECCGPFLEGSQMAPTAEALMRSRYTAFVLERADYLLATWHASHRPPAIEFDPGVKWLGLDVRQHRPLDDSHAEVEFVARQKSPGSPAVRLHERSRFVREAGRWYYVDGDQL